MATLQESQYSVYPMGAAKAAAPNFSDLGKPTVTVDVTRLQAELRALHQRLEFLEVAAQVAAVEHAKDQDPDGGSASSTAESIPSAVAAGRETRPDELDGGCIADDLTTETKAGEMPHSPVMRSATGLRKKAAAASAAMQAEVRDLSDRLEALASSCKRREKAQGIREKTNALAQSMEIKRIQMAIESRVTSDDLQLAVSAADDKIVAVQSSVESALSDRFRRMQDVVHQQMASLLSMVQGLTQSQARRKGSGPYVNARGNLSGGGYGGGPDGSDDDDEEASEAETFNKAVKDAVERVLQEGRISGGSGQGDVKMADFESLQEDYETFKEHMEEKADRQDAISSSLEDAQTRLEDAEANLSALAEELEHSSQDTREAMDAASDRQSDLDTRVRNATSLAADANAECAALRLLVGDSRREGQADARQEAEAITARAEARMKAEVSKARGDARSATEKVGSELKRHIKKSEDEAEGFQGAVAGTRALSEKAMAGATAAAARADECDALLQKAETRMGKRLDKAVQNQTTAIEDTLERVAAGESELARAESELRRLIASNGAEIMDLRTGQSVLGESSEQATEQLREEVQDALTTMVIDQDFIDSPSSSSGGGGGGGRTGGRGGGSGSDNSRGGVRFEASHGGGSGNNYRSNDFVDRSASDVARLSLAHLGTALRRQGEDAAQMVSTLQRSSVGIVTVLRKMEAGVHALSTKDLFWKAVDVKLAAHQRAVGEVCLDVEDATVSRRSRITLSKEAQACLAGDMQRVAKLMAVKADYEVIRELAKLDTPEQTGQDWDERVEFLRQTQMRRFLKDCRDALDKTAPEVRTNFNGEEIRGKFMGKLSDALKVALSKYSPTTPGATLFGKIKLKNSHITKDTFRPHTSHGRLGSPSRSGSIELFEPHSSIHSVMSGSRSSSHSPHVYRGGFKLPKHLKSPLHLPDGEDQSAFGIGHASPLLHKSQSMTGLGSHNNNGRPSTSGGVRQKRRPPNAGKFHTSSPPATGDGDPDAGLQDGGGNSIISAFTARTEYAAATPNAGESGAERLGFDDPPAGTSMPYFATSHTPSRPGVQHDGSVRLLT
ncbi:hypothetical protein Esi_0368_0016 [Ectocarpus siliculosus]|uniref:Uncharacterized protein n=1 Tax=Ectocarpus siliculosus TaxID=2880 RepID=D8LLI9_ECTSI|nr:hypothetical protein Esi_0368_0016 [Ectocarpus siliculosus]|eukprot:CBN79691.1 hypothetical protein Esi_0368_0016 [Ectocarpus siliculosus]